MSKRTNPLCIDLFCGLGGWTSGFLANGYDCVGFDNHRHVYGSRADYERGEHKRYPAQLVLQNVLTLHGSQFRNAASLAVNRGRKVKNKYAGTGSWKTEDGLDWRDASNIGEPINAHEVPGFNFHEHEKTGKPGRSFQQAAVKMATAGGGIEYGGGFGWDGSAMRAGNSKSPARKAASAMIAEIPFALSDWLARCFHPDTSATPQRTKYPVRASA